MLRFLTAISLLILAHSASAQSVDQANVVAACGTPNSTYAVGQSKPLTQDTTGKACGAVTTTPSATPQTVTPAALTPVAGAQYGLTLAAATALTVPGTATTAIVTVEGNSVRCTTTATTPTASVGMGPYGIGTILTIKLASLAAFQCIQTAASATIDVEYFK